MNEETAPQRPNIGDANDSSPPSTEYVGGDSAEYVGGDSAPAPDAPTTNPAAPTGPIPKIVKDAASAVTGYIMWPYVIAAALVLAYFLFS